MCIAEGIIGGHHVLVQGTYTHLCIWLEKNGVWTFDHIVGDFVEPLSSIEIDHSGTVWAAHLHKGLFSIRLSDDLRTIRTIRDHKSPDGSQLFPARVSAVNGRIVFTWGCGFYTWDDLEERIVPYTELNNLLGRFSTAYNICRQSHDSWWFITTDEAALVRFSNDEKKILDVISYSAFESRTVDWHQEIIPVSDSSCLLTLENALAMYGRNDRIRHDDKAELEFAEIKFSDITMSADSLLQFHSDGGNVPRLPSDYRNASFTLRYPSYCFSETVSFVHRLEGLEQTWSRPEGSPFISYSHLPAGAYRLQAEIRKQDGTVLDSISFPFRISPPFYLSAVAKVLYFIIFLLIVAVSIQIGRKRLLLSRLESEVKLKSKELAATTMNVIRKNDMLIRLREELAGQKQPEEGPVVGKNRLLNMIDRQLESDDDWSLFQKNFDYIHENFFRNLKIRYPELTATDLRFCAYLRMNLTSKDIASLMNISIKGVEAARSRIRKKISLPSEESLTGFFINFK